MCGKEKERQEEEGGNKEKEGLSMVGPPVILVLKRLKQKDCQFEAILGYTEHLCQSRD